MKNAMETKRKPSSNQDMKNPSHYAISLHSAVVYLCVQLITLSECKCTCIVFGNLALIGLQVESVYR